MYHKREAIYWEWHSHKIGILCPNDYEDVTKHMGHLSLGVERK